MTSKPSTARMAWPSASASATGTSGKRCPVIVWTIAWKPYAPISA